MKTLIYKQSYKKDVIDLVIETVDKRYPVSQFREYCKGSLLRGMVTKWVYAGTSCVLYKQDPPQLLHL